MVIYKYINGERYIINSNSEAKKQTFNTDIHDELNKITGMCVNEEKLLKQSTIDKTKKTIAVKRAGTAKNQRQGKAFHQFSVH